MSLIDLFVYNATYGVFLIAVAVSFVISLIYYHFIDHDQMQEIKSKMKDLKEKSKQARKEGNMEESNKYTKEMMQHSSEQMKMQLKPMAVTFILIIPLFYFVFPTLYSIEANLEDGNQLSFAGIESEIYVENGDDLRIWIDDVEYDEESVIDFNGYKFKLDRYDEENNMISFSQITVSLPFSLPLIGDTLGWLGWYIINAVIFGQIFRKSMGVM